MNSMNLNFAGKITHFFLHNRPLAWLVLIGVIASGFFSYITTPKQYNPEVILPAFQVMIPYPGATATKVETLLVQELEEKITDIPGVDEVTSRSMDGGAALIGVQFHVGEDLEEAKIKLQAKLNEAIDITSGEIGQPSITNINPDDVPIVTVGFYADANNQNILRAQVAEIADNLRKVDNIANVSLHGGQPRALQVLLSPEKLKIRNVSPQEVVQALQASNIRFPSGVVRNGLYIRGIEVDGTTDQPSNIAKIMVAPGVQLGDVATLEDDFTEQDSYVQIAQTDGTLTDAVFLSFAKKKGSNAVTVANDALETLDTLMAEKFPQVRYEVFRNDGQVASEAIAGLGLNLIQSIVIVSLVLFIFLGMRSALLVATSIPLTLGIVFFLGMQLGESINRITLFALILSLGLLVDSATVVVENIQRHIAQEKNTIAAITKAVNEVGIGLLLSTITSVIVFLPTSQISGMMGEYMGPLSIFVPLALIVALLVAYVLIPFLTALTIEWEQHHKKRNRKKKHKLPVPLFLHHFWMSRKKQRQACFSRLQKITRAIDVDAFFNQLTDWYGTQLSHLFANKKRRNTFLKIVFGALAIVLTFPLLQLVHFRMLPTADKNQFYVYIDAPVGYDLNASYAITQNIQQQIIQHPEVSSIQSFVGEPPVVDFNGLFKGAHLRSGYAYSTLRVNLTQTNTRSSSSETIVQQIRASLLADSGVKKYIQEGGSFTLLQDPPGPPVMATFMAKVQNENVLLREEVTEALFADILQVEGLVDVTTSVKEPYFRTIYKVNHEQAQKVGVYAADIAQTLQIALSSAQVNEFNVQNHFEQAFIEVRFPSLARDEKSDLEQMYIKSVTGEMVPLLSVVTPIESRNIPMIIRDNQHPNEYITAELSNRSVVYAVIDLISSLLRGTSNVSDSWKVTNWDLLKVTLQQQETGENVTIRWGGEWEMTIENFRDLGIAMIVAFILVYAVLVAQFRSFSAPAQIMSTVPLAFVGILPGFTVLDALNGTFLTATSLIGFIALMGIVVNNAILYLEYFMQLKEQGMDHDEALINAGKTRLRPILLTSLTTVLGSLTIAGDPVWSGLAWSIAFGLSLSAVLTLGVFPVLLFGSSSD